MAKIAPTFIQNVKNIENEKFIFYIFALNYCKIAEFRAKHPFAVGAAFAKIGLATYYLLRNSSKSSGVFLQKLLLYRSGAR